ncbi:hypothetical protein CC86DRAFT_378940 [Ophiobolus disseminans]|uniref:N-acetyltransferase domain-containing protein n=1 Tax=Ophiobolus disseminans TaxID=1469910 RepID=A0A6A7AD88_9PLEO|nr:hypothetical protein CC86DRAFT_378940 [Ophiobolus disseminans]
MHDKWAPSKAKLEDSAAIASLLALSWTSPISRLQYGHVDPAALIVAMTSRIAQQMALRNVKFIIIRDPHTQEVVSVAQWTLPDQSTSTTETQEEHIERQTFEDELYRSNLPTNSNKDLVMEFTVGLRALKQRVLQGRKHYALDNLATRPDYRGRGFASRLVEWVFAHADSEDALVYLETDSDNPAVRMYRRLGFEERGQYTIEDLGQIESDNTLTGVGVRLVDLPTTNIECASQKNTSDLSRTLYDAYRRTRDMDGLMVVLTHAEEIAGPGDERSFKSPLDLEEEIDFDELKAYGVLLEGKLKDVQARLAIARAEKSLARCHKIYVKFRKLEPVLDVFTSSMGSWIAKALSYCDEWGNHNPNAYWTFLKKNGAHKDPRTKTKKTKKKTEAQELKEREYWNCFLLGIAIKDLEPALHELCTKGCNAFTNELVNAFNERFEALDHDLRSNLLLTEIKDFREFFDSLQLLKKGFKAIAIAAMRNFKDGIIKKVSYEAISFQSKGSPFREHMEKTYAAVRKAHMPRRKPGIHKARVKMFRKHMQDQESGPYAAIKTHIESKSSELLSTTEMQPRNAGEDIFIKIFRDFDKICPVEESDGLSDKERAELTGHVEKAQRIWNARNGS